MSETQELAIQTPDSGAMAPSLVDNLMINTKQLNQIYKIAQMYARSSMVPQTYQGNADNCFVACELAARMNVSPVLVMQNLYIVQGKPSWAGQACKALIDGCGRFADSEYIFVGETMQADWGCYLQAVNKRTGKLIKGTTVTWHMAQNEGWVNKNGSKWKTMPEQMMKYRAAAFFARTECPEVLMGYQTADEVEDVYGAQQAPPPKVTITLNGEERVKDVTV